MRAHFGFSETLAGTNGRSTIAEVMDCADGKRIHPGPVAEDPFVDSRIMTVTPRRWPPVGGLRRRGALNLSIMLIVSTLLSGSAAAASAARSGRTSDPVAGVAASGKPYPCAPGAGQSIYGTFGDASAIGWHGCLRLGLGGELLTNSSSPVAHRGDLVRCFHTSAEIEVNDAAPDDEAGSVRGEPVGAHEGSGV